MLECWSCGYRFRRKIVLRDAVIRGREEAAGGPYRVYRCPSCHKESRIEATPRGSLFASPDKEISVVEFLFAWAEPLTPTDFLRISQWHRQHGERRRHFFERDGDQRYSRGGVRGFLQRLLGARGRVAEPRRTLETESKDSAAAGGGPTRKPRPPRPAEPQIPHPYRILGIEPGASDAEVRRAFQRLVRQWHPDKHQSSDPAVLEQASRRLGELLAAYEALRGQ